MSQSYYQPLFTNPQGWRGYCLMMPGLRAKLPDSHCSFNINGQKRELLESQRTCLM